MKIAKERSLAVLAQYLLIHLLLLSTSLLVIIGFGVLNDVFDGPCDKYDAAQGYLLNAQQSLTGELVLPELRSINSTFKSSLVTRGNADLDTSLTDRGHINGAFCVPVPGQPWGIANWNEVYVCTGQLDANHVIKLYPGCQTICTCGYSVIEVCNDRNYIIEHNSNDIANYARSILWVCSFVQNDQAWGGGQQFDTDGFNVIVHGDWTVAHTQL